MATSLKNSSAETSGGIDVRKLFFHYLSYWKWFLLSVVCFMTAGVAYLFLATPKYDVSASILIKDKKGNNSQNTSIVEQFDFFSTQKNFANEKEILQSYSLMKQVAKDLNLQVNYSIKKGLKNYPKYTGVPLKVELLNNNLIPYYKPFEIKFESPERITIDGNSYPYKTPIETAAGSIKITVIDSLLAGWDKQHPLYMTIIPIEDAAGSLRNAINVKASGKESSVINISMLTPLPDRGVEIINHLLKVYNLAEVADKNQLIGSTLSFIDDRLSAQENELRKAETEVQNFKSSQGITDISQESKLFLESVQKNDMNRSQIDIQLSVLKDIESYVLHDADNGGNAPATVGINDPTLVSLVTQLTAAEAERHKALRTLKPANPIILGYDDQIKMLKQNIIDNISTFRSGLEITQQKLNEENNRLERRIQSVPKKERELVDITRERDIKNQLYVFLLSKKEEAAISYASAVADSRLIDPAHRSLYPSKPVRNVVLAGTFILGLCFPVLILWIMGLFHYKISSKEEIEKQLRAPIVGEISQLQQSSSIIPKGKIRGMHAEQIRTLRTNIDFMSPEKTLRTILVTSNICGEGKSFLTANLGAAFAATGKRTVIMDFDIYKDGLHSVVGVENKVGICNYIAKEVALDDIIQPSPQIDNLDIITCGKMQEGEGDLLMNKNLQAFMEEVRTRYEYLIIDTPPLGFVSDALILSRLADVSIFMIRQDYTPRNCLKLINELYENQQMPNVCVVANGLKEKKWNGYISYDTNKYYENRKKACN